MVAPRLLTLVALTALAAALAVPAATAHTTVFSTDGKVRVVVGQLAEPVVTYATTGLDVCFTANTTARTPITTVDPLAVIAVLRSPAGDELSMDLRGQFGRPGCFQFSEPYVLSQPGQYVVDLSGTVNGTAVAFTGVNAGGAVKDRGEITFPDEGVASNLALQERLAALEAQVESLEADEAKQAPLPTAALLAVGLAALAAVRRLR
jgi:hypothetical protein